MKNYVIRRLDCDSCVVSDTSNEFWT